MDDIDRAVEHAMNSQKPRAQLVITLFDNNTTNLSYSCDEMTARALLSKGASILERLVAQQEARIAAPTNGDVRRIAG